MAGVSLTFSYLGTDAEHKLARLSRAGQDLFPLMDRIAGVLETSTVDRFDTNIAPDGSPWLPSERVKQAQGAAKTLVDRGHLRDSITSEATHNSATVGTNIVYAAIHQWGGKTGRNHAVTLPKRPAFGLSGDDRDDIGWATTDYVGGVFK